MILRLIHHSETLPLDLAANNGFDLAEIKAALQRLGELGISSEIVDISTMSEEKLSNLYSEAILPAVFKKYHVRQVFGSKRNSGFLFGRGVPALLVYDPGNKYPLDIYPHRNGDRLVTIGAFLDDLLKKTEKGPVGTERRDANRALVERMDRLREKIGPIGEPVSELIREGRRR